MQLHAITGLPRAGSTLLCNILNQNPNFYASSTSPLCQFLSSISLASSNSIEIKGELERDATSTENRLLSSARAFSQQWYAEWNDRIVFDKSRAWSIQDLMFLDVFPNSKFIVMIRDLRNIFASIEKQHRKRPLLDMMKAKTIQERINMLCAPDGLVGGALYGIMDLINRKVPNVIFVQYEILSAQPQMTMERLYKALQLEEFEHDFENVENTATDPDGHYLNKYPHKGSGAVVPQPHDEWRKYFADEIGMDIMQRFPRYNKQFRYV